VIVTNKKILLISAIVYFSIVTIVFGTYNTTYHMTGTSLDESVSAYLDVGCNDPLLTPHEWGILSVGETLQTWWKNEGNVPITVTLAISGLSGCTVKLNPNTFTLTDIQPQLVTITIETITEATLSWDIVVESVKSGST